jgi:sarcosine oxidase/L-pipecolate oxidase
MAFPPSKKGSVLIVGAGAFGLATALELSQSGYKDITVLERDSEIPSKFSAAFDINKIVRAEYEDPFYIDLSIVGI